jgi:hypothetical protein
VLGEGFQIVALPAAIEIARFLAHIHVVHPLNTDAKRPYQP